MTSATAKTQQSFESNENFADLFEASIQHQDPEEKSIVTGNIIALDKDNVTIDIGLKSEGRVPRKEFGAEADDIQIGDEVEVYLDRYENRAGEVVLSREKALREKAWEILEEKYNNNERVDGTIFGRVKGGFTVDLQGAVAFLPGSQVDIRPIKDIEPLVGVKQPFQLLKMDRKRGNIVVSRRAILEESRLEARNDILANISEGQQLDGIVKNITDYGAFIDLGGVDGLLHVTDISWRRINHPSEVLNLGDTIKVIVTKFDDNTRRISLGMKQLESNPWEGIEARFPINSKVKGTVTNITDYGAFIELEPGIEGLVHVSEMSWTKKNTHPGKIISTSQEVEVVVLGIDPNKHRISLGMKQCFDNPWKQYADANPKGTKIKGEIKNITEFGIFIGLDEQIDGLIHANDISWEKEGEEALADFNKGDMIEAVILSADVEREKISLGIKQLTGDPFEDSAKELKKGKILTCTVTKVSPEGLEVEINEENTGFIRKNDISRDRSEQRPEKFAEGDRIDAMITSKDKTNRRFNLSIKALEVQEEKRAIEEYGSSDSGASLGDILGAALNIQSEEAAAKEKESKAKAKK